MIYKEIKIPANSTASDICQAVGMQCNINEKCVVLQTEYSTHAICVGLAVPQLVIIGLHDNVPTFIGGMVWTK